MRFLTRDDLKERGIRYSNKHLITLEQAGLFPRRVRQGGGKFVSWVEDEIDEYQRARVAARDAAPKRAA